MRISGISIVGALLCACVSLTFLTGCESDSESGSSRTTFRCVIDGVDTVFTGIAYVVTAEGGIRISAGSAAGHTLGIHLHAMDVGTYDRTRADAVMSFESGLYAAGARWDPNHPGNQITVSIHRNAQGVLSGTFDIVAVESRFTATRRVITITDGTFENVRNY